MNNKFYIYVSYQFVKLFKNIENIVYFRCRRPNNYYHYH